VVPQGLDVLFPVVLGGDFGVLSWCFSWVVSGTLLLGFDGENLWEPFVVLWAVIPLPNPCVKGFDFGVFRVLGLKVFVRVDFRFLLIEWGFWGLSF
jgi:hypothetical protein